MAMSGDNGRNFVAIAGKAYGEDIEPCAAPMISPGKVQYFWEGFQDAFMEQVPGAGPQDLRQISFMMAMLQVWTWVGEARTDLPPMQDLDLGYEPDPCFPELLPNRRQWKDAILVSELNASEVDHRTRDLDDSNAQQLPTLYKHVAGVARDVHDRLDEKIGLLPQVAGELSHLGQELQPRDVQWLDGCADSLREKLTNQYPEWEIAHQGLVPSGLKVAYVRRIQDGSVVHGDPYPESVGDLLSVWIEAVQLTASTGGWLTSIYMMGLVNAVLASQTSDGTRILVTSWHRDAPFVDMVAYHEALVATIERMPRDWEAV